MKKYFYLAAVSAMMLTACSSEKDTLEVVAPAQQVTQQAVGFDVYVPAATASTRSTAGRTGTMTTTTLQQSSANGGGFGVFSYYTDNANYSASSTPNFMYNQLVLWNSTNLGWFYDPLKYWPNETNKDSQETPAYSETSPGTTTDKLSFFAYAPYVKASDTDGITSLPANAAGDPKVGYKTVLTDPNENVDLLWGVAPAGGLSYTAVNKNQISVTEGLPLIDMVKPNVNTNMKFLFDHALARIGIKAVAAIDQVAPGGKLDPNTKITIKSITLTGYFGETGTLNLNNSKKHVANWENINDVALNGVTALTTLTKKTITINGANIAGHLKYQLASGSYPTNMDAQTCVGVTTTKQDVIAPSTKYRTAVVNPGNYNPAKVYWTAATGGTEVNASVTTTKDLYTYDVQTKAYTKVASGTTVNTPAYPTAPAAHFVVTKDAGTANNLSCPDPNADYYTVDASGNYTYVASPIWNKAATDATYYILTRVEEEMNYAYASGTYYLADNNYYMVVPTNNIPNIWTGIGEDDKKALRTVKVAIEYYITTEDSNLTNKRAQTRNVIEKEVVFPSLENGKSYNLNLVLGLTSVKMEAEVDDWKVINVQGDLPQNTGE